MQIKVSRLEYEYTYIGPLYVAQFYVGIDLGGGLGLPRSKYIYIYIYIQFLYISFLQIGPFPKPQAPFSSISLTGLTQIATIQPKNLIKTIKTFTMVIVFQQKKRKKKNYFTTKEPKNHVLLGPQSTAAFKNVAIYP